ncbi:MAG: hypothetical protein ACREA4_13330, partial [Nitrososphaera sp.]
TRVYANWLITQEDFGKSIKNGQEIADSRIAASLYKRACGYSYKETKQDPGGLITTVTKDMPPDTAACIYWLNNRQKEIWRQTFSVDHRARAELEEAIDRELEKLAGVEAARLPGPAKTQTH